MTARLGSWPLFPQRRFAEDVEVPKPLWPGARARGRSPSFVVQVAGEVAGFFPFFFFCFANNRLRFCEQAILFC